MSQEEKDILLKDLCARLPYGVKVQVYDDRYAPSTINEINIKKKCIVFNFDVPIEYCKPYLRPMSSMTGDEFKELKKIQQNQSICSYHTISMDLEFINWYLAHHFDINHLIHRGLAIEVAEGNNPYKE